MTPEHFRQIEELYHATREAAPEERAALLAQADPELRRKVEALLAQPKGAEFLERPAVQNAADLLENSTVAGRPGQGGINRVKHFSRAQRLVIAATASAMLLVLFFPSWEIHEGYPFPTG